MFPVFNLSYLCLLPLIPVWLPTCCGDFTIIRKSEVGSDTLCFLINTTAVRCFPMAHAPSPRASSGGVCIQWLHAQISHGGGSGPWKTEHKWSTGSHWLLPGSNNKSKYLFITVSLPWLQCLLQTLAVPITAKAFLHTHSICAAPKVFDLMSRSPLSSNNDSFYVTGEISEIIYFISLLVNIPYRPRMTLLLHSMKKIWFRLWLIFCWEGQKQQAPPFSGHCSTWYNTQKYKVSKSTIRESCIQHHNEHH